MRRAALLLAAPLALAALLGSDRAEAMSCIGHAYERMKISLIEVQREGKVVQKPAELGDLDELLNSGNRGRGILMWNKATMSPAKFYVIAEESPAALRVAGYIASQGKRTLMTACRYAVPYTPILPGRYRFEQEHGDGSKTSRGIDDPTLEIRPGRSMAELRFKLGGRAHVARYAISCASFEWEKGRESCAPFEPDSPSAGGDAASPSASASAPAASSAPPPAAPPPPPPPITVERVPPPTARGCAACATAGAASTQGVAPNIAAALSALMALAMRRRRR